MRIGLLAVAGILALAATSGIKAQQTPSGQDDQFRQTRQTTSADWSLATNAPPEQAGDLYQGKGRGSGNFGGSTPPDNSILPGALNPSTESLDNGRQPDPKE
jgi:hypothetical protein